MLLLGKNIIIVLVFSYLYFPTIHNSRDIHLHSPKSPYKLCILTCLLFIYSSGKITEIHHLMCESIINGWMDVNPLRSNLRITFTSQETTADPHTCI